MNCKDCEHSYIDNGMLACGAVLRKQIDESFVLPCGMFIRYEQDVKREKGLPPETKKAKKAKEIKDGNKDSNDVRPTKADADCEQPNPSAEPDRGSVGTSDEGR